MIGTSAVRIATGTTRTTGTGIRVFVWWCLTIFQVCRKCGAAVTATPPRLEKRRSLFLTGLPSPLSFQERAGGEVRANTEEPRLLGLP